MRVSGGICKGAWLVLALMLVIPPRLADAFFFRYKDAQGHVHFVDDPGRVPEEYRQTLKAYAEKYDNLPAEERARRRAADEAADRARLLAEKQAAEQAAKAEAEARALSRTTPVVIQGGHVLVPVTLQYGSAKVDVQLLMDTGASLLAVHRKVVEQLQITDFKAAKARLADGGVIDSQVARLTAVTIGPYTVEDVVTGVIDYNGDDLPYQGLLGMNVLRQLNYRVDFDAGVIRWAAP